MEDTNQPKETEKSTGKPKKKTDFIGGFSKEEVRKAYFKRKMPDLLAKIQIKTDVDEEELEKLKEYLASLRSKEGSLIETVKDFLPEYDEDEVLKEVSEEQLTPEEQVVIDEEREKRQSSIKIANMLMKQIANRYIKPNLKTPSKDELMDIAFELTGLGYYIDEERLYRKQLYKKKIVEFEKVGKQRKAAEEYAQTTKEYRDYKRLSDLRMRMDSFETNARKRWGGNF